MAGASERRLFLALATLTRGFADGEQSASAGGAGPDDRGGAFSASAAGASPGAPAGAEEAREALAEAALAVAFDAFATQGGAAGPLQALLAALGLMAVLDGAPPDPPAEVLGVAAKGARVAAERARAAEALDAEFGGEAAADAVTAALEARILGAALALAARTSPGGTESGQAAVRLRAARILTRLAAGLLALHAAGTEVSSPPAPGGA